MSLVSEPPLIITWLATFKLELIVLREPNVAIVAPELFNKEILVPEEIIEEGIIKFL